jgi:hypothetical protein
VPSAAREARRRRTAAGPGKQMAPCPDWTQHELIGGGGVAGGGSGERRRRGCGGVPAAARVSARLEVVEVNARPWELHRCLGRRLRGSAGDGS